MKNIDLFDELDDVMGHSKENRFGGLDMWYVFDDVGQRAPNYRTIARGCDVMLVEFDAGAVPNREVLFQGKAATAKSIAAVIKAWELEG